MERPLALVGFMGSGKSTVGKRLAQRLGWYFCDLDDRIVALAGMEIPVIFQRGGEAEFRAYEREALAAALTEAETRRRMVVACGGGTFAQPMNRQHIQQVCKTIFLDVPCEELMLRCAQMTQRPLFRDAESFLALYQQRLPAYQQAEASVDAGGQDPEAVVERILSLLFDVVISQPLLLPK